MRPSMRAYRSCLRPAQIALPAAPVLQSVTVKDFFPVSSCGHAHAVVVAGNRGEVQYTQNRIFRVAAVADVTERAVLAIVSVNPFVTACIKVAFVQRRLTAIAAVQVLNETLDSRMIGILQHVPLQAGVVSPLRYLAELSAHEQQLLAGLGPHIR